MARQYIADLAGGTATVTIQVQQKQTLRNLLLTWQNVAAGKIELSVSGTPQIGTAQPDVNVIARVQCGVGGASGNTQSQLIPINLPVVPFQSVYIHQTGAGNIGVAVLS